MGDQNRPGRQDKRKAMDMNPLDSRRRQAPVRPVIGTAVQQLNNSMGGSDMLFSFSTTGNPGLDQNQSFVQQSSSSSTDVSFPTYLDAAGPSNQNTHASMSNTSLDHGVSFSTVAATSASSFNAVEPMDLDMPDWPVTDPRLWEWYLRHHPPIIVKPTLFNLLLDHEDVMYEVCRWLPATDLVNFYAVSKEFHKTINFRITTLILGNAQTRMPESAEVFHFKAYKSLCMRDPAMNISKDMKNRFRDVPTFRWLRFLEFREQTVKSILQQFALKGLRLPRAVSKVMKKIWFLMDLPDSKRRIGVIHNPDIWSDSDLFLACMFFLKLDMACADPMLSQAERRMKKLLLGQRTLSVLDRVLKREMMRNQFELLQMYTEWTMNLARVFHGLPTPSEIPRTVFGVPIRQVGSLRCQNWRQGNTHLHRPDELVMKESIRRGLRFQDKLIDMMLWGNIHPVTRKDVFPRDWKGDIQITFEDEVEDQAERDIAIHVSKEGTQFDWDGNYRDTT